MNESEPQIGVIVVNYNGADYISACLDSIQSQSLQPACVIIVDNASDDESLKLIRTHPLQPTLIQNADNRGFAAANNQAAKACTDCQWLALLNPDARADKHWLKALVDAHHQQSNYRSFASLQINASDSRLCDGAGDVYHAIGYAWRRGHNQDCIAALPNTDEVFSACGAAWLIDRDLFLELGGFDEDFFCYAEDIDLGFRLQLAGYKTLFIKAAVVHHLQSASAGTDSDFSVYYGQRNLIWVFAKNMPLVLLLLMLIPHLLFNLVGLIRFLRIGKITVASRAKFNALRGIPTIVKKRRYIQSNIRSINTIDCAKSLDFKLSSLVKRLRIAH